jgi:hypothetical protein
VLATNILLPLIVCDEQTWFVTCWLLTLIWLHSVVFFGSIIIFIGQLSDKLAQSGVTLPVGTINITSDALLQPTVFQPLGRS